MSSPNGREEHFFEVASVLAMLALIGCGVWFALKYVRHERQEGSVTHQLRRIDEEAQKSGWVKDANGTWSLPESVATNTTGLEEGSHETNKAAPGEK